MAQLLSTSLPDKAVAVAILGEWISALNLIENRGGEVWIDNRAIHVNHDLYEVVTDFIEDLKEEISHKGYDIQIDVVEK